jgi:hypothetical protein
MGPEVARQIEEFDGGEVGGGDALEDLLTSSCIKQEPRRKNSGGVRGVFIKGPQLIL